MSDVSDGYHTFDELYRHRAHLFAALCRAYPYESWWSLKHSDGTMFDDMFIAGMTLPGVGDISYHIEKNEIDLFKNVKYLEKAPEFTGYTADDVLDRIRQYFIDKSDTDGYEEVLSLSIPERE